MARDYKSRAQRQPSKKPIPVFVWLLSGYLLGVGSVGLLWLGGSSDGEVPGWINQDTPLTVASETASSKVDIEDPVTPPRFDFYTLLPEMEIVVPDDELEAKPKPPPVPVSASKPVVTEARVAVAPKSGYLLQVGAFKNAVDADKLKARLILQGYPATVSRVKTADGNMWSRVRVGPIHSADVLKSKRRQLQAQGYTSLVIKLKK